MKCVQIEVLQYSIVATCVSCRCAIFCSQKFGIIVVVVVALIVILLLLLVLSHSNIKVVQLHVQHSTFKGNKNKR